MVLGEIVAVVAAVLVAVVGIGLRQPIRRRRRDARVEWSGLKQDDWILRRVRVELDRDDYAAATDVLVRMASTSRPVDVETPQRLRAFNGVLVEAVGALPEPGGTAAPTAELEEVVALLQAEVARLQESILREGRRADRRYWIGTVMIAVGLALAVAQLLQAR